MNEEYDYRGFTIQIEEDYSGKFYGKLYDIYEPEYILEEARDEYIEYVKEVLESYVDELIDDYYYL